MSICADTRVQSLSNRPGGSILEALKIRASRATGKTAGANDATTAPTPNEQPFQAMDYVLWNATRFALKNGEHTWGKDVKSNLYDNGNWTNSDFHKAKVPPSSTASQYAVLEDSWWEQREWGIATTVDTLIAGKHRMVDGLLKEFAALQPLVPDPASAGFVEGAPGTTYSCGGEDIQFNAAGALTKLGSWVASEDRAVLQLKYRQYSNADVQEFFKSYCKSSASWVQHDYGKPDLPDTVPGAITAPTLTKLWVKHAGSGSDVCEFAAELAFSTEASTECGAPTVAWVNISITASPASDGAAASAAGPSAEVVMGLFNKTQTRLPEAMFLQFQPADQTGGKWYANKLGEWISSTEIVDGGTKHLHGVTEHGIKFESSSGKAFTVASTDAGVANFGNLTAYPSPVHQDADVDTFGAGFVLWDNLWVGDRYRMLLTLVGMCSRGPMERTLFRHRNSMLSGFTLACAPPPYLFFTCALCVIFADVITILPGDKLYHVVAIRTTTAGPVQRLAKVLSGGLERRHGEPVHSCRLVMPSNEVSKRPTRNHANLGR